jgi:hypothetical protein
MGVERLGEGVGGIERRGGRVLLESEGRDGVGGGGLGEGWGRRRWMGRGY